MRNPPAPAARQQNSPAPAQLMRTRSNKKKAKTEVQSKQNQDKNKPSGKKPKDPLFEMNPPSSAAIPPKNFKDSSEDENVKP